jgi:hypothetical protein
MSAPLPVSCPTVKAARNRTICSLLFTLTDELMAWSAFLVRAINGDTRV